jgi:hypothetical protein
MKSEITEILLPPGSKVYKESPSYLFIKAVMLCGLVFGACLAFYRYETKLQEMEFRVSELTLKVFELENNNNNHHEKSTPDVELDDGHLSRSKRQIASQRLADNWITRSADGDPELNYRDYSTEEGLVANRRQQRRRQGRRQWRPPTEATPVRNHDDETFFTTDNRGQRFYPSGLKEMRDRLPPLSAEQRHTDTRHAPELRTRSLPPVRRVGRGRDQVSARVMNYDEDKKPESVAAHFVADVSNFTSADNPRLRNSDGVFQIWRPEEWNTKDSLAYDKTDGTLTILKPGIYYVYAQIHYHDENVEGFKLEVNEKPLLQCTSKQEVNSCFTAGLTKLNENDKIVVKNIGQNIFSIFKPEKSFFGLMRVSEI